MSLQDLFGEASTRPVDQDSTTIAGADAYKQRWVVASECGGSRTKLQVVDDFPSLLGCGFDLLVIDVPIGLMEAGRRHADYAARALLGPRRNSVFPAPLRPALGASSWEEACAIRQRIEGKRYSKQTFGILPLIRAVDRHMTPALQERVREGHPEVSFRLLHGSPLLLPKTTEEGHALRKALLLEQFPDLERSIDELGRPGARNDVLDAYSLLWTARRIVSGSATVLPPTPQIDTKGLRAEIVA